MSTPNTNHQRSSVSMRRCVVSMVAVCGLAFSAHAQQQAQEEGAEGQQRARQRQHQPEHMQDGKESNQHTTKRNTRRSRGDEQGFLGGPHVRHNKAPGTEGIFGDMGDGQQSRMRRAQRVPPQVIEKALRELADAKGEHGPLALRADQRDHIRAMMQEHRQEMQQWAQAHEKELAALRQHAVELGVDPEKMQGPWNALRRGGPDGQGRGGPGGQGRSGPDGERRGGPGNDSRMNDRDPDARRGRDGRERSNDVRRPGGKRGNVGGQVGRAGQRAEPIDKDRQRNQQRIMSEVQELRKSFPSTDRIVHQTWDILDADQRAYVESRIAQYRQQNEDRKFNADQERYEKRLRDEAKERKNKGEGSAGKDGKRARRGAQAKPGAGGMEFDVSSEMDLPSEMRERIAARLKSMPPEQRQRAIGQLRKRMEQMRELSPEERREAFKRLLKERGDRDGRGVRGARSGQQREQGDDRRLNQNADRKPPRAKDLDLPEPPQ